MATLIANGDIVSVRTACYATDQVGLNSLGFQLSSISGTPTLEGFATGYSAVLRDLYAACMALTAQYYGLSVQRIAPTITQPIQIVDIVQGFAAGNLTPRQSCGIVAKKGDLPGRPGRGRIYVPFLADSLVGVTGHLNGVGSADIGFLAIKLFTSIVVDCGGGNTVTTFPCILNRPAPGFNLINSYTVRTKIATQRRRGDYGRSNAVPW